MRESKYKMDNNVYNINTNTNQMKIFKYFLVFNKTQNIINIQTLPSLIILFLFNFLLYFS